MPFHFLSALSVSMACGLTQWTQHTSSPSAEWRHLTSTLYVDQNLFPSSFVSPVEIGQASLCDGNIINVPVNRIGKRLSSMSVLAYIDRFTHFMDACLFRHGMRVSRHLTKIGIGGETRLTYTRGVAKTIIPLRRTTCGNISTNVRPHGLYFRPHEWESPLWAPATSHGLQICTMDWLWRSQNLFSCD